MHTSLVYCSPDQSGRSPACDLDPDLYLIAAMTSLLRSRLGVFVLNLNCCRVNSGLSLIIRAVQQFDIMSPTEKASKYCLRVTAGPDYDPATHQDVPVNQDKTLRISSGHASISLALRIQDFTGISNHPSATITYSLSLSTRTNV